MIISIVIPAYNEEKYIGKTLDSIEKLDKNNWEVEVVVVNGGSTDNTVRIAQKYGAKVINELHKGIGFARQQGLLAAQGDIVAFTDADTIVPKDWLTKHINVLRRDEIVFSYGAFKVFDGKFPYYQYINYLQTPIQWLMFTLFRVPLAAGQNIAFWREKALLIHGFNYQLKAAEDVDIAVRMKKVGRVIYSPNIVVYSSGRRSNEGRGFFIRIWVTTIKYFLGKRDLQIFPDYR